MNAPSISKPKFDTYTIKARLIPVFIVVLPGAIGVFAWFPEIPNWWGGFSALIVASGIPALLGQLGRDAGKRKEPKLFSFWGGKPSTRLLRYRDAPNKVILSRQHQHLRKLLPELEIPTPEEEIASPEAADQVYDACVHFLRERTRDKKRFPLVFEENCNYGFRRNLWGMKPLGIGVNLIGLGGIIFLFIRNYYVVGSEVSILSVVSGLAVVLILIGWFFWFTPNWVKTAADAYGERLLAATEEIES